MAKLDKESGEILKWLSFKFMEKETENIIKQFVEWIKVKTKIHLCEKEEIYIDLKNAVSDLINNIEEA